MKNTKTSIFQKSLRYDGGTRSLAQVTQTALRVLCKEIGIVNTVRFINQFTTGYGDYTREREQLFAEITLEDIVSEIKEKRNQTPARE